MTTIFGICPAPHAFLPRLLSMAARELTFEDPKHNRVEHITGPRAIFDRTWEMLSEVAEDPHAISKRARLTWVPYEDINVGPIALTIYGPTLKKMSTLHQFMRQHMVIGIAGAPRLLINTQINDQGVFISALEIAEYECGPEIADEHTLEDLTRVFRSWREEGRLTMRASIGLFSCVDHGVDPDSVDYLKDDCY
jgi:hypothetical protein